MSDLVGISKDRFSHDVAQTLQVGSLMIVLREGEVSPSIVVYHVTALSTSTELNQSVVTSLDTK